LRRSPMNWPITSRFVSARKPKPWRVISATCSGRRRNRLGGH
jgi:hypothetical protein